MTDENDTPETNPAVAGAVPDQPEAASGKPEAADRIAKVMARAGVASRREAERMIVEGRVTVNGKKIDSPALDVLPTDRIVVDGKKLEEPQETRLWLYYKPVGLVTSEADEKGRQTVFDALPRDLPRVMSVGRLDLNSEGLLLLTNDGELKRRLELPETGWLRRYRVRVNGQPNDLTFAPLRRGVTIEGEDFAPMEIKLDSQQGANAWLTVGIREGRNREIRRAMSHVGLQVNRLIRIGYGPFKLTGLEENEVREVKRRVLRDQLGGLLTGEAEEKERPFRARGADDDRGADRWSRPRDGEDRPQGGRKFGARDGSGAGRREGGERERPFARRGDDSRGEARDRKPFGDGGDRPRKPFGEKGGERPRKAFDRAETGERPRKAYGADGGDRPRKAYGSDGGDRPRKAYGSDGGDRPRKAYGADAGDRPRRSSEGADRPRKPYGAGNSDERPRKPFVAGEGARKPRWGADRAGEGAQDGARKPYAKRAEGERGGYSRGEGGSRPAREGAAPGRKPYGGKPSGDKPFGKRDGKPQSARSGDGDGPRGRGFASGGEGRSAPKAGFKPGFKSGGKGPRGGESSGGGQGRGPRPGGAGGGASGRPGGPKPTSPRRPKG